MMEILKDARYALRTLRKTPAFAATALAALALGIGANTAIFSVIDTVLLRPLNYPDPDRIVLFLQTSQGAPSYGGSAAKFNAWRRTPGFEDVSAYEYRGAGLNLTGAGEPEQIHGIRVSADYFRLLGAPIERGRTFTPEEDRPHGLRAVVLSHGLWQRRFGGDLAMLGKSITLSGAPYVVVGIVGPGFQTALDSPPDVWLPFQVDPESTDHAQYFNVIGRLAKGVTTAAAGAQLELAANDFRRRFPNIMGPRDGFTVQPFTDSIVSDVRPSLLVLAAAVALVLLISCANVASLLLVRATGRKREIAVRAAMGATRWRIVRQLLAESVLLSSIGGGLGLALGLAGVRALLAMNSAGLPRIGENGSAVTVDWRLLLFTTSISLATGILFGLFPALNVSRADLGVVLKEGGGRSGTGLRQNRTRSLLVIGEIALALILLAGAALLMRTFWALRAVDPGFEPHHVLTVRMSLTGSRFEKTSGVNQLIADAVRRLEALPGVEVAAASYNLPLEGAFGIPFNIVGRTSGNGRYDGRGWTGVSPGYFTVFRIGVLAGREFDQRDDAGAPRVAIINQAMARQFWPGYPLTRDPLRDRVILGKGYGPEFEEPARQIVGVVADVHDSGLNHNPSPMVYVPLSQVTDGITTLAARASSLAWVARTHEPPDALRSAIARELEQASGGLPVAQVRSMDQLVAESTSREDFNMTLLSIFGCSALLLAVIGIYGLMTYSVEQRTREIGIRLALGADSAGIRSLVVGQGMRLAALGVAAGTICALGLTRFLAAFLFGVKPWDLLVFTATPIALSLAALVAVWIPARRAGRTDPACALRGE
ncbi:MAG TPA: ABC transporter permease [Bryobacteraceae bacterium]